MPQDPASLIKDLKLYFDQSSHDIKNLFQYLTLWFDSLSQVEQRAEARATLEELRQTYLTKIVELREKFDEYLSVASTDTTVDNIESLAAWIDQHLANVEVPGRLIKQLDEDISIKYPSAYLKSIISSLLDNSIQYRQDNQDLVIKITLYRAATGEAVLRVQDNGIGIDLTRYSSSLFQPFRRFTGKGTGQGLSLHLVKTMVEKNGGDIQLESSMGEGTTVTVFLKDYP